MVVLAAQPVEALRWLGIAAMAAILLAAIALQATETFDASRSVSQVWSRSKRSRVFIGVVLTVFGALLCVSLIGWHIPAYHLSILMYPLVALAYLALLAVAWVPMVEKPGEHSLSHPHFIGGAVVATGSVVGFLLILLAKPAVPALSFWLSVTGLAYGACWPLFMSARLRNYFFVLEVGLVLVFMLQITALTVGI